MKRALFVLLAILLVVIILAGATVQIVLWSDWPRSLVQSIVRDETGLDIRIDAFRTGWSGRTTVDGISVRLPLEDAPLFEARALEVSHAGLLRLAATRSIDLSQLTLHEPHLTLREDDEGEWNVSRLVDILSALGGKPSDGDPSPPSLPALPSTNIRNATVDVVRNDGKSFSYTGIELAGRPEGEFAWAFELNQADDEWLRGRLMTRAPMRHELAFELHDLETLIRPWMASAETPLPSRLAGAWTGGVRGGVLSGRLRLDEATVEEHELTGTARLTIDAGRATIRPEALRLRSPRLGDESLRVESGRAAVDVDGITLERILLAGYGTRATVDGAWKQENRRGEMTIAWEGAERAFLQSPWLEQHSGTLRAVVTAAETGTIDANVEIDAETESARGDLTAGLHLSASGRDWRRMTTRLHFSTLHWRDNEGLINADGLAFNIALDWPGVTVSDFNIPGPSAAHGRGTFMVDSREWTLRFEARDWVIPRTIDRAVYVDFDAHGDLERLEFTRLELANEEVNLSAAGRWDPAEDDPLAATARLHVNRPLELNQPTANNDAPTDEAESTRATVTTTMDSELNLRGSVEPLELAYDGRLILHDLPVGQRVVRELAFPWNGVINDSHATFRGESFELFGGQWTLNGDLAYTPRHLMVGLSGGDVPLGELLALADVPVEMSGVVATEVELRLPELDVDQLEMSGAWEVADLRTDRLSAGRGHGQMRLQNRELRLEGIRLEQGAGWLAGDVLVNLDRQREVDLDLTANRWPVSIEDSDLRLLVGGRGDVVLDLIDASARGTLDLDANVLIAEESFADVAVNASVDRTKIRLDQLRGRLLGGEITAKGSVTLGEWLTARLDGEWERLDLAQLEAFAPRVKGLVGASSGRFSIARTEEPRPLGPVRIDVESRIANGSYRGELDLTGFGLRAYVGKERAILDRGYLDLADGRLGLWGRSSMHGPDRYVHGQVFVEKIDLHQALHAIRPDLPPTPGRLNGRLSVGSYVGQFERTFGSGEIYLTQSDLGALPAFDFLYNLLRFDFGGDEPSGYGVAEVRLEGTMLDIPRMEYFNRGTDIAASVTVHDLTRGGESPINGVAVGAVLPFRNLDLPLFGDLDRLVTALQAEAVAVRIEGTLAERRVRSVDFAEVGATVQRILGGSGGSAGGAGGGSNE